MTAAAATRAHDKALDAALAAHHERFAAQIARELRGLTRQAVKRFTDHQQTLTASGEPIRIPHQQELADAAYTQRLIASIVLKYRAKAAGTAVDAMGADLGASFEVRNRILDGVIQGQSGALITTAPDELIGVMMASLQESYDTGASIPHAAKALRDTGYTHAKGYAERIARTETLRAVNSASLALVHATDAAKFKVWMATMDKRTRPHHRDANGQTVGVKESFSVGGSRLQYPGDPSAPADEVILCRCALGYSDDANLDLIAGGSMATAEAVEEVAAGAAWSGPVVQEGVDTGDGRRIAPGALAWRELPLTMMSQHNTPGEGGHADAQVAGRIDTLARNGGNIDGAGVFDTGAWGAETQRLVTDGMLKGISVDLAVEEYEIIPAEGVEDPDEAMWLGTLNILKGTILGATIVPFPAFENASIAITASANRRDLRKDGDTLVASFYMPFAPFPPAKEAPADSDAEDAKDGGSDDAAEAVADIRAAVNGYPGLDGKVVVTIDGEDTTIAFPADAPADDAPAAASAEVEAAFKVLREALRNRIIVVEPGIQFKPINTITDAATSGTYLIKQQGLQA